MDINYWMAEFYRSLAILGVSFGFLIVILVAPRLMYFLMSAFLTNHQNFADWLSRTLGVGDKTAAIIKDCVRYLVFIIVGIPIAVILYNIVTAWFSELVIILWFVVSFQISYLFYISLRDIVKTRFYPDDNDAFRTGWLLFLVQCTAALVAIVTAAGLRSFAYYFGLPEDLF